MKRILYIFICTAVWLMCIPGANAQVNDEALTRSGAVGTYNGTRSDFLTMSGKLSRYPKLSKAGESLKYAPIVTTDSVPEATITSYSATVFGNILFNGWESEVIAQGFELSTNPDFEGDDVQTVQVTPENTYVECDQPCPANVYFYNFENLIGGSTYYVRAYATNAVGTSYGETLTFVIENTNACPGTPTVTDHEGNIYTTVQLGYQCWMRQNMRCTHFPDGEEIPYGGYSNSSPYSSLQPYYYNPNGANPMTVERGYLYNWPATLDTTFTENTAGSYEKRRGICPKGWHVPTIAEWRILLDYLKENQYSCDDYESHIAKAMASTTGWYNNSTACTPGNEPNTNNLSGFTAVPANYFYSSGNQINDNGYYARFWSSTTYKQYNSDVVGQACYVGIEYSNDEVYDYNSMYKQGGFSVRCLRDTTGLKVPTLEILGVSGVTTDTARVKSNVVADGGAPVTERGICWSVDTLPTIDSYRWVDTTGTGLGDFTSIIRNLTPSHKYHVRAYAINFEGVGYSADSTFTAPAPANACQGTPTVTDRDGNVYNTVQIGYQCWTRENMRCTTLPDGRKIGYGGNNNNNRRCYDTLKLYYSDTITATPLEQRGYLYNWYAAMDTVSSTGNLPYMSFEKRQGICPDGWHVPSAAEWDTLNNYSKRQSEFWCEYYGSYYIAKALASKYWWQPYQTYSVDSCYVGVKPEQNNVSGMSIVPSGYYYNGGNRFENTKTTAYFWSSSLYSDNSTYYKSYNLSNSTDYVMGYSSSPRSEAIPVRCLRDTTGLYVPTVTGSINEVGTNEASFNGEVTKDGGETVTNRGFCYSMNNQMPTINDNYVAVGDGLGEFSELIGYLVPGKTYYVRAYATNYEGTGYSDVMTITTGIPDNVCPNVPTVTDHEGNVYNTVQIGNQCWTRENMRCKTTPKNPNVSVSTANSYGPTSSYAPYIYTLGRTDSVWINYYGYSYNWPAAMDTAATEVVKMSFVNRRGICPEGWHIPSSAEWDSLFAYVRTQDEFLCNNSTSYIVPSLADKYSWEHYNSTCVPSYNSSENNATGFTSVAAGYFNNSYSSQVGRYVYYWTSTTYSTNNISNPYNYAYNNQMSFTNSSIDRDYSSKSWGYSVRCVMNQEGAVEMSNATVITTGVSEVTTSSATFHGEVTFGGNSPVTERGFCWSHSENPTVENDHNNFGTGVGEFEGTVNVFLPGYTYHVRAYAINALGVSYGEDMTFTTSRNFHVNTLPYETDFTDGEAWFNTGSNDYGYWMTGTTSGYCDGSALYVTQDGESAGYGGNYSYDISAEKFLKMPEGDSIHVEFDVLAGGDDYSNFLKVFIAPTTWNFAYNSSYYNYNYSTNALNFRKYLCLTDYSSYDYKLSMTHGSTIHVSVNMRNPSPNDTAKIAFLWRKSSYNGSQPGAVISNLRVSTISAITDSVTEVTTSSAKVYGEVKAWGDVETVTERGICWSVRTMPTVADNHIACGSGAGRFNAVLSNLTPNTRYHVRAYAKNSTGHIVYSDNKPFATELLELKADTLPYYTHFADAQYWSIDNGSAENIWTVAVPSGSNDTMLYVTNDIMCAGEPGYYTSASSAVVTAEKLLVMPNTPEELIVVSFDVKVGGESTCDYLKVFLAPESFEVNSDYSFSDYAVNFSDYLSLTEYAYYPYKLNLTNGNTLHVTTKMVNPAPGDTAKLIFLWRNDGGSGKQPGAIISNVSVGGMILYADSVKNVTKQSAQVYSTVHAGGAVVASRGICYSNTPNPTIEDSHTSDAAVSGHVVATLTNLEANTLYYVRPYAISTKGVLTYGTQLFFTTEREIYVDDLPYDNGFTDANRWYMNNSLQTTPNRWVIGVPADSTANALFVTIDGERAEYDITSTADIYAVKLLRLPAAELIHVECDLQVGGESCCDHLYMYLSSIQEGVDPTTNAFNSPYEILQDAIQLTTKHLSVNVSNPSPNDTAKLIIYWHNDHSVGVPPAVVVTNLKVTAVTKPSVNTIGSSYYQDNNDYIMEGEVVSDGGSALTARGVCYSDINSEPTLLNSSYFTSSSTQVGTFAMGLSAGSLTPGATYYFRAYATNGVGTAYGEVMSFTVAYPADCEPITDFPFTESFENGGNMPDCWSQEYVNDVNDGTVDWMFQAGSHVNSGIGSAYSGNYNAYLFSQTRGLYTMLISPVFDLSNVETPYLSFWHTQKFWPNDQDELRVYYRTSSTAEWQPLAEYTGNIDQWTLESLALPNPSSTYQIAFEGMTHYGYGVTLDSITVGEPAPMPFSCGDNLIIGENEYATVAIGHQCWMKENIREAVGNEGGEEMSDTDPLYYVNTNSGEYFYNPVAANMVCPPNWHLPSVSDWTVLTDYVGDHYPCNNDNTAIAKALASETIWTGGWGECTPSDQEQYPNNASHFSAIPAGSWHYGFGFDNDNYFATFWTSTENNSGNYWLRQILAWEIDVYGEQAAGADNAFSVRCVYDEEVEEPFSCGADKLIIGQNEYDIVAIGHQCWMKENIREAAGSEGGEEMSATAPLYYVNTNSGEYNGEYYYNVLAAMEVCPEGWHLPTVSDWTILADYVGSHYQCGNNNTYIAKALASESSWNIDGFSGDECSPLNQNQYANNASHFSAVSAGECFEGAFYGTNESAYFWTSTEDEGYSGNYWFRQILATQPSINVDYSTAADHAFSVRCVRDEEGGATTATIPEVNTIGSYYYQNGDLYIMECEVVSDGGSDLTERGVCYSITETEPTLDNSSSFPSSPTEVGLYNMALSTVTPGVTYYFRAYATNSVGTAYGETKTFYVCGGTLTDTRNNQTYQTMMVDDVCWMKENLRYQGNPTFTNGDHNNVLSYSQDEAYIYYPGGQAGALSTYGYLYNWAAATNNATVTSEGMQGVCPDGWHLPTYNQAKAVRDKLSDATFKASFLDKHAGYVLPNFGYRYFGEYDWFWATSSGNDTNTSLDISGTTWTVVGNTGKNFGRSIRCVKE